MQMDMWTYEISVPEMLDLSGFSVEATDGSIGHVDEATYDIGASYLVVETGPWIFGKKVLLPASAVQRLDLDNKKVFVRLTKDQIKSAPEFDENTYMSEEYRNRIGAYYGEVA